MTTLRAPASALVTGCAKPGMGTYFCSPERILQLKGTATEIIQLSNGERTVADILQAIEALYSSADPKQIEREAESFLDHRLERRAVDFP